jgi:hypothetical protein
MYMKNVYIHENMCKTYVHEKYVCLLKYIFKMSLGIHTLLFLF